MGTDADTERKMLRHILATLAYRTTRAVENAPPGYGTYRVKEGSRTPVQIVSHLSDLCGWTLSLIRGQEVWRDADPGDWNGELERFYRSLAILDEYLATQAPIQCPVSRLMQGPMADALSHAGQLALLRRLAGSPMRGENFFRADIEAGRVGPDQPPPRRIFD